MATKLSKNDIQAVLYMLCPYSQVDFTVQLLSPNIQLSHAVDIIDVGGNPLGHWNGRKVYLWLNPMPMLELFHSDVNGMRLQVPLDYIDCIGELELRMNVNISANMYQIYGERWNMALYDAVYKLFDGKVDFRYPDTITASHVTTPKEWATRERFGDMPRLEDFDFSHIGDLESRVEDCLVKETKKPYFRRMFGNSLEKTDTGLEFVECNRNGEK